MTNIKQRILQIAKNKGFSYENFCKEIDVSYSGFKGNSLNTSIKSDTLVTL
jgi:hypothetical protein